MRRFSWVFFLGLMMVFACADIIGVPLDPAETRDEVVGAGGVGGVAGMGGMVSVPCPGEPAAAEEVPSLLSQTGLYRDMEAKALASYVQPYEPRFPLWSDGSEKNRWVYWPCDTSIDRSDRDDWSFPVGTRFWKEFVVAGRRIETRLLHRFGAGADDFVMVSYQWNAEETEATRVANGARVMNAGGTAHDIPSEVQCQQCHGGLGNGGRPSRVLGYGAVQLGEVDPPGDAVAQAALGYLHSNCGTCHNSSIDGVKGLTLDMWLRVADTEVVQTATYTSAVGQATVFADCDQQIMAGDAAASCVVARMSRREPMVGMPPMASEVVDPAGVAAVTAWIDALPVDP